MGQHSWNPDWSFLRGSIILWLLSVGLPLVVVVGLVLLFL
jgi:hypothetical protein